MLALLTVTIQLGISLLDSTIDGYSGFLVFGFLIGRVLGVYHPPTDDLTPLSPSRKVVGWLALIIFVLCFSPKPFVIL